MHPYLNRRCHLHIGEVSTLKLLIEKRDGDRMPSRMEWSWRGRSANLTANRPSFEKRVLVAQLSADSRVERLRSANETYGLYRMNNERNVGDPNAQSEDL